MATLRSLAALTTFYTAHMEKREIHTHSLGVEEVTAHNAHMESQKYLDNDR